MKSRPSLSVNGEAHDVLVPVHKTLLEVLREDLGLIGTKHGCELGECEIGRASCRERVSIDV